MATNPAPPHDGAADTDSAPQVPSSGVTTAPADPTKPPEKLVKLRRKRPTPLAGEEFVTTKDGKSVAVFYDGLGQFPQTVADALVAQGDAEVVPEPAAAPSSAAPKK